MNNKKVSVIIPTYGGPKFLHRCIEGVLNQSYPIHEVIVVDDNGVGTANQIATQEAMSIYESNQIIKYICHSVNKNGAAARNTGVRNATGDYIALLDDDDVFLPNKIERQVRLLDSLSENYALVYCSHEIYLRNELLRTVYAKKSGYLFYEKLMKQFEVQTSGVLLRKEVFDEVGGFDESFSRHQDWEFIERIMSKYKIQADDFIGYRRELLFRSDTTEPKKAKEWRMHYLNKMSPYISMLPPDQAKEVIVKNKIEISLEFLRKKDILGFIKEFCGSTPGFFGNRLLLKRLIKAYKRSGTVY